MSDSNKSDDIINPEEEAFQVRTIDLRLCLSSSPEGTSSSLPSDSTRVIGDIAATSGTIYYHHRGVALAGVSSMSLADGTEAEFAAPAAACPCCGGATSLEKKKAVSGLHVTKTSMANAPFNLKSSNTRLRTNFSYQPLEHDLRWGRFFHLLVIVLCILIVADPHELLVVV